VSIEYRFRFKNGDKTTLEYHEPLTNGQINDIEFTIRQGIRKKELFVLKNEEGTLGINGAELTAYSRARWEPYET